MRMQPILPQPEAPPPEPPVGLWTSLVLLGIGLALGLYVLLAAWSRSGDGESAERASDGDEPAAGPPPEAPNSSEHGTEHPDEDVV